MNIQDSRILIKRSTVAAVVATIPVSSDHTDGSWLATDIYKGEIFINLADGKYFTRVDSGIVELAGISDLTGLWDDRGNYDASVNLYPSSGGSGIAGAILKGDIWTISVAGVLGGVAVGVGDTVRALVDTPAQVTSNWAVGENNIGYVPLSNVLNSANIFVGNASNVATGVVLSGEASILNTGAITLLNGAVIGKVLTGLSITGGAIVATDTILEAFGKTQNQINNGWLKGGNTLAATSSIGSNDAFDWGIKHSGVELMTVTASRLILKNSGGQPGTGQYSYVATTGRMVVGASNGSTSGGVQHTIYGMTGGTTLGLPMFDNSYVVSQYNGSFVYSAFFIANGGNILIGTDTSSLPTARLDIRTFSSSNANIGFQIKNSSAVNVFQVGEGGNVNYSGNLSGPSLVLSSFLNEAKGANIASAATTDIGAATGNYIDVTGTTTITALGTVQAGTRRVVNFTGILILTHNATSLILPTSANITTAVGDTAIFISLGSGNWKCVNYNRLSGSALVGGGGSLTVGTSAITSGTVGRLLFEGTGSVLQENANLAWDITNNALIIGGGALSDTTSVQMQLNTSVNAYRSAVIKNASAGVLAAGDFTAIRDDGTYTTNFASFGINSSTYNDPAYPIQTAGSGYAFVNGGKMVIGTQTAHDIVLHTGGTALTDRAMVIRGVAPQKGYVGFIEGNSNEPVLLGKIHIINETDAVGTFYADRYSTGSASAGLNLRKSRGTFVAPTAVQSDDMLGQIRFWGYGASAFSTAERATISANASQVWTNANQGTYIAFNTTTDSTTTTAERMRLASSGALWIGTTAGNASALLDLVSTTKGFGLMTQTTAQRDAITTPRDGLKVYCSDGTIGESLRVSGAWVSNPNLPARITVLSPSSAENITLFYTTTQMRVARILSGIIGGTSVTFTIRYDSDRSAAGTEVVTGGTACTNKTTGLSTTTFNAATIPANMFVWLVTTAKIGAVTELNVSMNFN